MFHACVQRFDVMDVNFLGGELNRALDEILRPNTYFRMTEQSTYSMLNKSIVSQDED
jgi:hypothetical protein